MRRKKLRKREEAGTSSSLGLEAAIHESTSKPGSTAAVAANGGAATGSAGAGGGDHGSRAARAARLAAAEQVDAGDKRKRFDTALAKAGERANEKLADSFAKPASAAGAAPPPVAAPDPMAFAEELDSDLGVSLARARRLAQMKDKAKARKSRDVGEVCSSEYICYFVCICAHVAVEVKIGVQRQLLQWSRSRLHGRARHASRSFSFAVGKAGHACFAGFRLLFGHPEDNVCLDLAFVSLLLSRPFGRL